eukprot:1841125-Amphidinium_carterae.1
MGWALKIFDMLAWRHEDVADKRSLSDWASSCLIIDSPKSTPRLRACLTSWPPQIPPARKQRSCTGLKSLKVFSGILG